MHVVSFREFRVLNASAGRATAEQAAQLLRCSCSNRFSVSKKAARFNRRIIVVICW